MPVLDAAEEYFGKPGEIIICGFSGARTVSRVESQGQGQSQHQSYDRQTCGRSSYEGSNYEGSSYGGQESPRASEMRYTSPPTTPQRSSGYSSSQAGDYQQTGRSTYGTSPSQYSEYSSQGSYRQANAAPAYQAPRQQYPAKAAGFYESSASSRYY